MKMYPRITRIFTDFKKEYFFLFFLIRGHPRNPRINVFSSIYFFWGWSY